MPDSRPPDGSNVPEWTVTALSTAIRGTIEDNFGRLGSEASWARVPTRLGACLSGLEGRAQRARGGDLAWPAAGWRWSPGRAWKSSPPAGSRPTEGSPSTRWLSSRFGPQVKARSWPRSNSSGGALKPRASSTTTASSRFRCCRRPLALSPPPSGSVIRDILHRIRDRFPSRVIVWPAAVQGAACPGEVSAALAGFNALQENGPVPRPDVIIVARGGGSVEDLAGFSDERVVRAVADSAIPVISAIGHETDTALCDHAADMRAPTPTAAAERAVPESAQLRALVLALDGRRGLAAARQLEHLRLRLTARSAGLPRSDMLLSQSMQRVDNAALSLASAAEGRIRQNHTRFGYAEARLQPALLGRRAALADATLERACRSLQRALRGRIARSRNGSARLRPGSAPACSPGRSMRPKKGFSQL